MVERGRSAGAPALLGRTIAEKYEILRLLGAGAMGEVYAAKHRDLDRYVAIKVLKLDRSTDPLLISRFKSEARAASRIEHPNSVQIIDFGEEQDGTLYIVMELLKGQDLQSSIKRIGRIPQRRACAIIAQVLDALVVAHQNSVIHRDLKPANIMLIRSPAAPDLEVVKVCDFGIAKLTDPSDAEGPTAMMTMTKAGAIVGTPSFMAPEQARGDRVDKRSDIYSCGVILYYMVTGQKPFKAENLMGMLHKVANEAPKPPSQLLSTIDARLERLMLKAMAKNKLDRFQTAQAMRAALEEIAATPQSETSPPELGAALVDSTSGSASGSAFGASGLSALPPQTPLSPPPNPSLSPPNSQVSPMQSMGGSFGGTIGSDTWNARSQSTPIIQAAPTNTGRWLLPAFLLLLSLLGTGYVYKHFASQGDIDQLTKYYELGSYGAFENYALEHFEDFKDDVTAKALIADNLKLRREMSTDLESLGVTFDPHHEVTPSRWRVTVEYRQVAVKRSFFIDIQSARGGIIEGYADWPEHGSRVSIRGYWSGNHLIIWEDTIIASEGPQTEKFVLKEKKNIYIVGDKLVGYDGPYRRQLVGERAPL